ncbi:NAD+ diphosphatase [Palleronia marisminoris]|uniref:NAD(+) diphosphatase n=1 Tax=Palleronia marisminoris TaxID=315423 RepID=A0A1Y5SYD1_9RHOB|nr:NAD(+) diphosphatase [Palleronia marisminoris]SFG98227.1 NAD+ diphosphatase [Palleronia marisminoris]SLN48002.1 NADH pyrophosphatase [Palleronia marisminoris]
MRDAELVTFGGSALDRAVFDRTEERERRQAASPKARTLLLWRGKPAVVHDAESGGYSLARVPLDHSVLAQGGLRLFLGLDGEVPTFATDLSAWSPQEIPDTLGAFADPSTQAHPDLPDASFVELRGAMTQLSARAAELAATGRALLEWHRSHGFCAYCGHESHPHSAGWQRLCTACGRRHFPRTDPVVIMLVTHGNSVLLGRSPGWPEGMHSLLAGFVEPGETIEAAVRRETWEETGIRIGGVDYLASQPWPFPASLMIGCRGHATTQEISVDPVEIESAQWLSREELAQAIAGEHDVKPARPGSIAHFLLRNWLADRLD